MKRSNQVSSTEGSVEVRQANRSVIVTGSNGEIGTSICRNLANQGTRVYAVTRRPYTFEDAASDLVKNVVIPSIEDEDAIDDFFKTVLSDDNSWLGLVYGAAIFHRFESVDSINLHDWREILAINLVACFSWNRRFASHCVQHGVQGSVVNITSQAAFTGGYGGVIPYAASKGAMISMTKGLAREFATSGVRFNCVAPGFIETGAMRGNLEPDRLRFFFDRVPMERFGTVDEVASLVRFLLADESSYTTGATFDVTGGQLMH